MMDTLSQTIDRLTGAGFVDDLVAVQGTLRSVRTNARYVPEELMVAEVVRFEGASNPDDEAIVFALATPDGAPLGTFAVAYGPELVEEDAEVVMHLIRRSGEHR